MQLRAQFPETMKAHNMRPPPRYALSTGLGAASREICDRRRDELERWMWHLIAQPEVARSIPLRAFLDFEKALQRAQQQRCADVFRHTCRLFSSLICRS